MIYKKKLIEVALPLEAINAESAREKSIRHGHPSTLHLWWARRPLAAARAVIWASLVDDPSSLPEQFPTEELQNAERERLFDILTRLVKWENSNNQEVLNEAKAEIMKSTGGNPPPLLDPFAGGGAIPLEAQRLGLEAHASDLNPVAVMINKAMIEIPPKFAGQPPVNPDAKRLTKNVWTGAKGLAEDVRYYSEWMKQKAFERIGHLYPKVKDENGEERTVIAWIWARTVKCPNPACGCEMPLASSFELSKKKGKEAYIQPVFAGKKIRYEVKQGKNAPEPSNTGRGKFKCIACGESTTLDYIRSEFVAKRNSEQLLAVVAEGKNGRLYFSSDKEQVCAAECPTPENVPQGDLPEKALGFRVQIYGMTQYKNLFTNRQLTALTTFCELVHEAQEQMIADGGTKEYAQAVAVYLAFVVDKLTDYHSTICSWHTSKELIRNTFGRQAIPMVWDFTEANPFCSSSGSYDNMLDWVVKSVNHLHATINGVVSQHDAQTDNGLRNIMVSTDPPYYDNIGYADLSDFFYVWMRQLLKNTYPELFRTLLVPKAEELIAAPFRFEGSMENARRFFEEGMLKTFKQVNVYVREDIPVTIYYAFKQSDSDEDDKGNTQTASTGWETMLSAIIQAGFSITGTLPVRTEGGSRMRAMNSNALASSIVLVCRKRPVDAAVSHRRDFINTLKKELPAALKPLLRSNIAPVDLEQAAIGPGMAVFSRYSKILEADGAAMTVRTAYGIIIQTLGEVLTEQEADLDADTRWALAWFQQHGLDEGNFGDAETLSKAKGTAIDKLQRAGTVIARGGKVRLLKRKELPTDWQPAADTPLTAWTITQHLIRVYDQEGEMGAANLLRKIGIGRCESAKDLSYQLYKICNDKGMANEGLAYNSLVQVWHELIRLAGTPLPVEQQKNLL